VAFKRASTPPGPVTQLFDRLHDLHLRAGEPSTRRIATDIGGGGVISYATVYAAFRGPRVPNWAHLELIVLRHIGFQVAAGTGGRTHAIIGVC
jgi:hypothetical protein